MLVRCLSFLYVVLFACGIVRERFSEDISLDGGKFQMGIDDFEGRNGEAPSYQTAVKPFRIDKFPVTNYQFSKFADAKRNFSTEAEEKGWSFVFVGHLDSVQSKSFNKENLDQKFVWMIPVLGTTWKMPTGPGSSIDDKLDHPVVHVSQRDASAYCRWAKKRLPSEYEWEYAARGGLKGTEYPWGDEYQIGRTNLWQGPFPDKDTGNDGFAGTSPVDAFPSQNNYELFDMVGNVWEWTNTKYHIRFHNMIGRDNYFTVRGGSYLDSRRGHVNLRARVSARDGKMFDYSAGNVGFRCASSENVKTGPSIVLTKSSFVIHSEL